MTIVTIKQSEKFQVRTTLPEQLKAVALYINHISDAIDNKQLEDTEQMEYHIGIATHSLVTLFETFDDTRNLNKN